MHPDDLSLRIWFAALLFVCLLVFPSAPRQNHNTQGHLASRPSRWGTEDAEIKVPPAPAPTPPHPRPSAENQELKLQALVDDILPSTTAVFSYAIGSRKLSANEQVFVGAQTVVSLLQTTEIKQGVSFIAANKVYNSTNKTTIVWMGWMCLMFTWVLGC